MLFLEREFGKSSGKNPPHAPDSPHDCGILIQPVQIIVIPEDSSINHFADFLPHSIHFEKNEPP